MKRSIVALAAAGVALAAFCPMVRTIAADAPTAIQSVDPHANETKAQRDKRMHWWREARFGMFIHWGLYAVPAGTWDGKRVGGIGEWIMNIDKIPVADYASLTKQFDPTEFNADTWVGIAKAAGMKYIVMTAKHHEGFAMFHSSTDPFNIYDATPFKRDPIAEMAAACKKQGLKFGVYYSQAQDWHHAGGAAYGGHWDKAQDGDLHQYVRDVAAPQVTELLTKYKPAVLWWDTPVDMTREDIKALTAAFAKDPELIANNRLGNGVRGDSETPEQTIPATGFPGRDWETCMTINDTWGYKSYDTNFKSTSVLLHNLIDIASKGGNYLLNVGPTDKGVIPAGEVERLQNVGEWLKHNGESIYGTSASPYKRLPFNGRATVKGNAIFLNVFEWPDDGLRLPYLKTAVRSAKVLATRQRLDIATLPDGTVTISKPTVLDAVATAIKLDLVGPPVVDEPSVAITVGGDGKIALNATDAVLTGDAIQVEGSPGNNNIGFWTHQGDYPKWTVLVPANQTAGYSIEMTYSCEPAAAGSIVAVLVDNANTGIVFTPLPTKSWMDYTTSIVAGNLNLSPGKHEIALVPKSMPGSAVMNLRQIKLSPISR